jgi:hypothetical protein
MGVAVTGDELARVLGSVGLSAAEYARLVSALAGSGPQYTWSTIVRQIQKAGHVSPQAAALAQLVSILHEAGQLAELPAYREATALRDS